jgi:hypothetical protein
MRGATSAGNDHLETPFPCGSGVFHHQLRRAVRRHHGDIRRDTEFLQHVRRVLHDRKIGTAAHDDANCCLAHCLNPVLSLVLRPLSPDF